MALTGGDELLCTDVGGIRQMLGRDQTLGRQRLVDRLDPHDLVHGRRGGIRMDDQVRRARVAGLGQVDHVADPGRVALGAEASLSIVVIRPH
ncbi:hypothetical protein ADL19_21295 [Streptomyces purpurogeneiscleroticus]|nr:hypothetical protein ADL19_21295 [Streptomyces purpurogeneiscleroticus]